MAAPPRKHILLVTFPAYGHIIPILELGKKLSLSHDVSLAVSAFTVDEIKAKDLVTSSDKINFLPINDGYSANNTLDPSSFPVFIESMNIILPGIKNMIATLPIRGTAQTPGNIMPVDVIICELFIAAYATDCVQKDIDLYHFSPNAIGAQLMYLSFDEKWPTVPDDIEITLSKPPIPGAPLPPMPQTMKKWSQEINNSYRFTKGMVINSVKELEEDAYNAMIEHPLMKHAKIFPVGPLIPAKSDKFLTHSDKEAAVKKWLDVKPEKSVLYVSFGSMTAPNAEQVGELSRAFLTLKKPVIWSLQADCHVLVSAELTSQTESEVLILPWVPQKLVLSHPSIGLFISHCGWNSTLESLSNGIPVVGWPMFADQLINALFLESKGTGVVVHGTGLKPERTVPAAEVVETVKNVTGWDGNDSSYRDKAIGWKEVIQSARRPGGRSFDSFAELNHF